MGIRDFWGIRTERDRGTRERAERCAIEEQREIAERRQRAIAEEAEWGRREVERHDAERRLHMSMFGAPGPAQHPGGIELGTNTIRAEGRTTGGFATQYLAGPMPAYVGMQAPEPIPRRPCFKMKRYSTQIGDSPPVDIYGGTTRAMRGSRIDNYT